LISCLLKNRSCQTAQLKPRRKAPKYEPSPTQNAHGQFLLPTSKQFCSGENCGELALKGFGHAEPRLSKPRPEADGLCRAASSGAYQPDPDNRLNEENLPLRTRTHRSQAQHRARTPEYPKPDSESTKSAIRLGVNRALKGGGNSFGDAKSMDRLADLPATPPVVYMISD
jgi:hypothetical protein